MSTAGAACGRGDGRVRRDERPSTTTPMRIVPHARTPRIDSRQVRHDRALLRIEPPSIRPLSVSGPSTFAQTVREPPPEPTCPGLPRTAIASWSSSMMRTACAGPSACSPRALEPEPLDLEILALVASMRHVLSSQIHRRFNPGRASTTTQRRLKRLSDAGLVRRFQFHRRDGGGVPMCYAITAAGLELLHAHGRLTVLQEEDVEMRSGPASAAARVAWRAAAAPGAPRRARGRLGAGVGACLGRTARSRCADPWSRCSRRRCARPRTGRTALGPAI